MSRKVVVCNILFTIGMVLGPLTSHAQSEGGAPDPTILAAAAAIHIGEPVIHENLSIYPLIAASSDKSSRYTPLDTAMDKGKLRVKERASASVPSLDVKNTGRQNVFVMAGEIVTGAKQDRMSANDTILPPTAKSVELPVYCVEQGRWQQQSRHFSAGKTAGTTMLRKTAAKKGAQGVIWSKVAKKSRDASVRSDTGTMQAVYNNRQIKKQIAAYEKTLLSVAKKDDVVGFIAAVDGNIISADLFADNHLMRALYSKLLKAIAVDAVTSKKSSNVAADKETARMFFSAAASGQHKVTPNPGLGKALLIEAGNDINGTALIHGSLIVHLALFGPDKDSHPRVLPSAASTRPSHDSESSSVLATSQQKNDWPQSVIESDKKPRPKKTNTSRYGEKSSVRHGKQK